MAWIKLDDEFSNHDKVRPLSNAAFRLWLYGKSYCACHRTDGFIPFEEAEALAYKCLQADRRHGVTSSVTPQDLIDELVRDRGACHSVTSGVTSGVTGGVTAAGPPRDRHAGTRDVERDGHARERDIDRDSRLGVERDKYEHWLWELAPGGYQVHDWSDYQPTSAKRDRERQQAAERKRWQRDKARALSLLEAGSFDRAVKLLGRYQEARARDVERLVAPFRVAVDSGASGPSPGPESHAVTSGVTSSVTDSPRTPSPSPEGDVGTYVGHAVTSGVTGGVTEAVTESVTAEVSAAYEQGILDAGWPEGRPALSAQEKVTAARWEQAGLPLEQVRQVIRHRRSSYLASNPGAAISWLAFFEKWVERELEQWRSRLAALDARTESSWPEPVETPEAGHELWLELGRRLSQAIDGEAWTDFGTPMRFQGLNGEFVLAWVPNAAIAHVIAENFGQLIRRTTHAATDGRFQSVKLAGWPRPLGYSADEWDDETGRALP